MLGKVSSSEARAALLLKKSVGTLLKALDERPLQTWKDMVDAVPGRVARARGIAARRLVPNTVKVSLDKATLRSEQEVDEYLVALKMKIMQHVAAGKPVIL